MPENLRVLIAGGGTGGHLFPAIAIGEELRKTGAEVRFIGSKFGIEAEILPKTEKYLYLLNIRGIQRSFNLSSIGKNLLFPYRFLKSYLDSKRIIKSFDPHVVVGTGGYSSGLPMIVATKRGCKTLLQEQNSYPGLTVRKLAKKVDKICIAFNEASKYFPDNWIFSGNPVRNNIEIIDKQSARQKMNLKNKPTIFILGGSQGSRPLNHRFMTTYKKFLNSNVQIIWQCGTRDYEMVSSSIVSEDVHLFDFISNMGDAYSASDIVVSRAGAITLAELTYCKKASVLVPFPHAAGDHQTKNAIALEKHNAARVVKQSEFTTERLENTLLDLLNAPDIISELEKNAGQLANPNATQNIVKEILELVN
ncbi:MAG: undecaprenyldiphospho-muramoylpentapeptide beta-N-acetylglucosaminyltransferase [Candidatus Marinimicrobia bacterium]|nr:undecaprenyldiphospho-muramoylpentapeptide beta-N-acetylglucosaminyltransferase [Candidatus Neomarinimicrobiota bacterium]MBL7023284.1 undecaprenyldiphospho-muramoylpentapeptide beta-N-acetylglucosaminyltransferase [Candidatus Neomarinimicrobiota bacterium]MBL7108878.1 undecaprenyldiphospho-muramoylpentapeptide beta-N-acetylglucosaminyltransferase [Candidatus Neomarinimicrobiota bacterium]